MSLLQREILRCLLNSGRSQKGKTCVFVRKQNKHPAVLTRKASAGRTNRPILIFFQIGPSGKAKLLPIDTGVRLLATSGVAKARRRGYWERHERLERKNIGLLGQVPRQG